MNRELLAGAPTTVAEFGLTWFCQSAALLGLGLIAGRLLRSRGPAIQSAVYRTTLVTALLCPVASIVLEGLGVTGISIRLPGRTPIVEVVEPVLITPESPPASATNLADQTPPSDESGLALPTPAPVAGPEPVTPVASPATLPRVVVDADPTPHPSWRELVVPLGLATWLLGVAWLGLRLGVAGRRMARLRAGAIAADSAAESLCQSLAKAMRLAPPQVLRSPFLSSPCLDGLRQPTILLPEDDGELDLHATFVHELAHLARRDGLWNLLRRLTTALFWFQPLLWAVSRRIEVTAEEVCDDHVVQFGADRARYAGLLLQLAGRSLPPLAPAGVGMISLRSLLARRVVRILDLSRPLSTRAGTRAVSMTLLGGSVGTLLVGWLAVGAREPQAQAAEPPPQAAAEAGTATQSGRVLTPSGQPIPGAVVMAIATSNRPAEPGLEQVGRIDSREVARAVADLDGRYTLSYPKPNPSPDGRSQDFSTYIKAPGFGVSPGLQSQELPLVPDDVPVLGRLVDLEAKPVAGATVRLTKLWMPWPATRTLPPTGPVWFAMNEILGYGSEWLALLPPIVTDADGRFRVDGVGRDRLVELEISRPDLAVKRVHVVTRTMDHLDGPPGDRDSRHGLNEPGQYGADCVIVVEPTRVIEGIVRDIVSGAPIPGTIVAARRIDEGNLVITGEITARTDTEGRYRLVGLPKSKAPAVAVYPPLDQPYFLDEFLEVTPGPGYDPIRFDIPLRRGQWITGRVFNNQDNKPVAAAVDFFPLITNGNAANYPNFDPLTSGSVGINERYQTDAEGRFRVVGLAGPGVVTARPTTGNYRAGFGSEAVPGKNKDDQLPTYNHIYTWQYGAIRAVDLPADGTDARCDLPLDPGDSVVLRLVDEAGQPVKGANADGRNPYGSAGSSYLGEETSVRVAGLLPGKPRTVVLEQANRKIGQVIELPADGPRTGQEQTVILRPNATVTARFVGTAFPQNVHVRIETTQAENAAPSDDGIRMNHDMHLKTVAATPDGRFQFDGLPAGGTFALEAGDRLQTNPSGMTPREFRSFAIAEKLTANPGQVLDLGTFDVTTGKRVEAAAEPAKVATRTVTGQVVGPDKQPVAGARILAFAVRARRRSRDQLPPAAERRDLASTLTDAEGRFALTYPEPEPSAQPVWHVSTHVTAPGFGPVRFAEEPVITLPRDDVPILGRIVDLEGTPVTGASIAVRFLYSPDTAAPRPANADPSWFNRVQGRQLGLSDFFFPSAARSDAGGRFRVDGLGRGRLAVLEITGPTMAVREVQVVTRPGDWIADPAGTGTDREATDAPGQFGATCTIVVEPTRVIKGVVRDAATNEPLSDVVVASAQINRQIGYREGLISARTDAQGHYRLVGLPKGDGPTVSVYPPPDKPYFVSQRLPVPITPGYEPVSCDITLKSGVWISGRVTDVRTGQAVMASVAYFPFLDNPAAAVGYPNFQPNVVNSGAVLIPNRTDADGRFRVVGLPGHGVVTARTDDLAYQSGNGVAKIPADFTTGTARPGRLPTYDQIITDRYQSIQAVDIPAGTATFTRDLPVDPGGSVTLRPVDEAGQFLTDVKITHGRTAGGARGQQGSTARASTRIGGLVSGVGRTLVLRHDARDLGAVLEIPPDGPTDGRELTVVLHPAATISGRMVDAAGQPIVGLIALDIVQAGALSAQDRTLTLGRESIPLDADGRFRMPAIPVGGKPALRVGIPVNAKSPNNAFKMVSLATMLDLKPGSTLDIGTYDATTGKRVADQPAHP